MSTRIEIFYSFQSPYSYLALESICNIEDEYDVEMLWQPFSAKASGQQVAPAPINPDKISYIIEDTKRYGKDHDIPLEFPEMWPESDFDPNRITRGAIVAGDMGIIREYNYIVFHHIWGLGENPNEDNFMSDLCDDLDVTLGDFLSKLSTNDTRERVRGNYRRGKKLGVFDTPTFVINGEERLWGIDKLPYIEQRLLDAGLKRK